MRLILACSLLFCFGVNGQDVASIKAAVAKIQYPPIAERGRFSGDVIIDADKKLILSGPRMLRQAALDGIVDLSLPRGVSKVIVHFELASLKRGNRFTRIFMPLMFMTVWPGCGGGDKNTLPKKSPKIEGETLHVWKYGVFHCVTTVSSQAVTVVTN